MAATKSAILASRDTQVATDPALSALLEHAAEDARRGGVQRRVLEAIVKSIRSALDADAKDAREQVLEMEWEPSPDQIWRRGRKTEDGRPLTAYRHYLAAFKGRPLPYSHQVRNHPRTKEFYFALLTYTSRNKERGQKPDTIEDLFPVTIAARGGHLTRSRRPRRKRT